MHSDAADPPGVGGIVVRRSDAVWKVSWGRWSELVLSDPRADAAELLRHCSGALRDLVR
ncbi:MAG: hypothetical protein IR158_14050 [Cellulomonas sp.]|uniref:hypothetical protein n=1 Tax=Cellulomonas sp. TaxID=40001 RepID=UPI0019FB3B59|nr:hypothetical protein [Cellulomonas sp.]MBF0688874.1 hypothetical protein [Cellulomonas sp.]